MPKKDNNSIVRRTKGSIVVEKTPIWRKCWIRTWGDASLGDNFEGLVDIQ